MPRYRRSRWLLMTLEDVGLAESPNVSSVVITSVITGQHLLAEPGESERLGRIPCAEWAESTFVLSLGFCPERIEKMIEIGIIYRESIVPSLWETREELLLSSHWPPCAAAFHLLNHYAESRNSPYGAVIDTARQEREATERSALFLEAYGAPPPEFYQHPKATTSEELPLDLEHNLFTKILLQRRTCRHFKAEKSVPLGDVSRLLRLSLGAWGSRNLASKASLLLKTSPSGGSLHPIEGFPIVLRCDSKRSGIYHYQAGRHALVPLKAGVEKDLRSLAVFLAQGQDYVGTCAILVVLVARFDRNFWKYRERENSYAVVLQDAGHLSQTFQLVATDMGLGAFYTAAINSEAIVDLLELRYPAEAPLGILGFGIPEPNNGLKSRIEPFNPDQYR